MCTHNKVSTPPYLAKHVVDTVDLRFGSSMKGADMWGEGGEADDPTR